MTRWTKQARSLLFTALVCAMCATCAAPAPEPIEGPVLDPVAPETALTIKATADAVWRKGVEQALRREPWAQPLPDPTDDLPEVMPRNESWRRGISLGLFASTRDASEQRRIYTDLLDEIVAAGATDVSLVVRWHQTSVTSSEIAPREGVTLPDDTLRWVMQAARERDLRIFLMPIIHLEKRGTGLWRGTLTPEDPEGWWRAYRAFILHYADLASDHDADLLAVGSELLSMESRDARWRALIAEVRQRYSGALTYSANWDHYRGPTFWDALDVMGLTGYHELTDTPNPSLDQIRQGWGDFRAKLEDWSAAHDDMPYIFTEIGYPAHRDGAKHPWHYTSDAPPAHALQARCYRAMMLEWEDAPRLAGVYIWNWFGFKTPEDRGYTPRGKPAETILTHWYTTSEAAPHSP